MPPGFEIRHADAAGRVGDLSIPRADARIETPALLPVINPHVRTIEPKDLPDLGAQALITNAYIFYGSDEYREAALTEGLHELLEFPGPIMTDSGSFQLAEYGEIDVTTEEILRFQREIGSDIATPVDIPTDPEVSREQADAERRTTEERLEVATDFDAGEMRLTAPVQGSTYPELRERAGRKARATGLDVFPVGGVVPLLNDYRYSEVVEVVTAAKRGLGPAAPVHLFGAGHPMTFALAAALGCDLFDSAAYALYARDGRYLTVRGTEHLSELEYFPCACPVCAEHDPGEIRDLPENETDRLLAEHNLRVSFAEIRRIRGAIRAGTLLELVEARARGHPALLSGYRALLDHADWLEANDPVRKGTFFYLSAESARRPEVCRHHERLARLDVPNRLLLAPDGAEWCAPEGADRREAAEDEDHRGAAEGGDRREAAEDGDHRGAAEGVDRGTEYDAIWRLAPAFGPVPPALSQSYPLTAETPDRLDAPAREAAIEGVARLTAAHPETTVAVVAGDWPRSCFDALPEDVELLDPHSRGRSDR